jgi:hypothetical protein
MSWVADHLANIFSSVLLSSGLVLRDDIALMGWWRQSFDTNQIFAEVAE